MKFPNQFNFRERFVISVIVIGVGVGVFLFYLISTPKIDESEDEAEVRTPDQRREAVLESPGQSTVQSSQPPSQADIEKAIAVLESLDGTERRDPEVESSGDPAISDTLLTDNGDRTPLNYEETRKQRIERIRNSPEYKAFQAKMLERQLAVDEWRRSLERPAQDAHIAYMKNPYSIFGLTEAEADEIEWSEEQLKFVREEGKRLFQEEQAESTHWREVWYEKQRQTRELSRQLLKALFEEDGQ